jgi:hypothetical protein
MDRYCDIVMKGGSVGKASFCPAGGDTTGAGY